MKFAVDRWWAWSTVGVREESWRRSATLASMEPSPPEPDVAFVPKMQRRRMSALTRMAMHAAWNATGGRVDPTLSLVFASRHGEVRSSLAMLRDIVQGADLSPTTFSHSVHNAPAGQLSIHFGCRGPSSSVSAGRATFACGIIDAVGQSYRLGGAPVLLVVADEVLPAEYSGFADEPQRAYATATILRAVSPRQAGIALEAGGAHRVYSLPTALAFLEWLQGSTDEFSLPWSSTRDVKLVRPIAGYDSLDPIT